MANQVYVSSHDDYPKEVTIETKTDDLDIVVRDENGGRITLVTKANFAKYYKPKKEDKPEAKA